MSAKSNTVSNSEKNSATAQKASEQAIGIFDSGIGGLSIANCISQQLPNEKLIYVADSGYAPYGELSIDEITRRVNTVADFLIAQQVKAIVVACNTATVNAIEQLRARVSIPIIGVEPAIKPASIQSTTKNVGILVTSATAKNERFLALVKKHSSNIKAFIQPCPGLVQLIEHNHINTPECTALLKQYITPLNDNEVDTIVLGCTHYPFVASQISLLVNEGTQLIETAMPVTIELTRRLKQAQLCSVPSHLTVSNEITHLFYCQQLTPQLQQTVAQLWQGSHSISLLQTNLHESI